MRWTPLADEEKTSRCVAVSPAQWRYRGAADHDPYERQVVDPEGWPMKGRKAHAAAAIEAFEEAGVVGRIGRRRLGKFKHRKEAGKDWVECAVEVFPLAVK